MRNIHKLCDVDVYPIDEMSEYPISENTSHQR